MENDITVVKGVSYLLVDGKAYPMGQKTESATPPSGPKVQKKVVSDTPHNANVRAYRATPGIDELTDTQRSYLLTALEGRLDGRSWADMARDHGVATTSFQRSVSLGLAQLDALVLTNPTAGAPAPAAKRDAALDGMASDLGMVTTTGKVAPHNGGKAPKRPKAKAPKAKVAKAPKVAESEVRPPSGTMTLERRRESNSGKTTIFRSVQGEAYASLSIAGIPADVDQLDIVY